MTFLRIANFCRTAYADSKSGSSWNVSIVFIVSLKTIAIVSVKLKICIRGLINYSTVLRN